MKLKEELVEEMIKETVRVFTRNGLALLSLDTLGMMFLSAATAANGPQEVAQIKEGDVKDPELMIKYVFAGWNTAQLTTKVGIRKLVQIIGNALKDEEYANSTVIEGSTKLQFTPMADNDVSISLVYLRERNKK